RLRYGGGRMACAPAPDPPAEWDGARGLGIRGSGNGALDRSGRKPPVYECLLGIMLVGPDGRQASRLERRVLVIPLRVQDGASGPLGFVKLAEVIPSWRG